MASHPVPAFLPVLTLAAALTAQGDEATVGWLRPPEAIARLVEAPPPPQASLSPQRGWLVLVEQEPLPGIDVVARPHWKLGGLRVDCSTRGPQLGARTLGITLRALADGREHRVDLPAGHWSEPRWSADDRAFVLEHTVDDGIELWVADPATAPPRRLDGIRLAAALGSAVQWLPDQRRLLVKGALGGAVPARPRAPAGPQVQASEAGAKAQVRTYQDLLQDAHDEAVLTAVATCQLEVVDTATGGRTKVGSPAMWDRVEPSPDGSLLLLSRLERPFSYLVPQSQFPRTTLVLDLAGAVVRELERAPLREAIPIGGVPVGRRSIDWVPTLPHVLHWTEALDGGDPRTDAPHRDQVFLLPDLAGEPRPWFRTEHRAAGLQFAADGFVMATEFDRRTRRQRVWRQDWADPTRPGAVLYERSTQDAYGDPGRPLSERSEDGRMLLRRRGDRLFLAGDGASPTGARPFVDAWDFATGARQRLFHCAEGRHETFVGFLDRDGTRLCVRTESSTEPPSLVVVDTATGARTTLLRFPDPAAEFLAKVEKRLLRYRREDGVELSGTLYLPPRERPDVRLPVLLWAYPLEYSQASDAGQVRAAPNRWTRLGGASHLFLLLAGYAVFDDAAMPIVGPQRTANDTFVLQVQQNARAAIDALAAQEGVDATRVAVAGHSYGAFMTANLLAHTDLFRAGIARSGAYNRTLTPFGFQNEERTYWEAPEVYAAMSPFTHAHRIDEPLLLVHGADDNNPGTFPLQSQRLFAALKGHGRMARLCLLPHESHGYRSREGVLHCLAETVAWLDRHLAKPATPK